MGRMKIHGLRRSTFSDRIEAAVAERSIMTECGHRPRLTP